MNKIIQAFASTQWYTFGGTFIVCAGVAQLLDVVEPSAAVVPLPWWFYLVAGLAILLLAASGHTEMY
jgi:hypothetical protein